MRTYTVPSADTLSKIYPYTEQKSAVLAKFSAVLVDFSAVLAFFFCKASAKS